MLGSQIRRRLLATVSFAMLAGAGAVHAADTPAANAESANVESVVITAPLRR